MDADRFATLLRAFVTRPSRRSLSRSLAALLLGSALPAWHGLPETTAKKKHKQRKKKRQSQTPPPASPPPAPPVPPVPPTAPPSPNPCPQPANPHWCASAQACVPA